MKYKWKKLIFIFGLMVSIISAVGYLSLKYLQSKLEEKLFGSEIENSSFYTVLPFEYVNNWIVVRAGVKGSIKEYPFIFDTGAQTVLLDSLLEDIGSENYDSLSFVNKTGSTGNAFNNELLTLHQLNLGGVKFNRVGAISAKNSKWGMLNCISPYGIIGYNVLQTFYSQIDYEKKQIIMTDDVKKLPNYNEIQWIDYKPTNTQESPIIKAKINDSINVELLLDTGSSGGVVLNSNKLFNKFINEYSNDVVKYIFKSTIKIRGEIDDTYESITYNSSDFSIDNFNNIKMNISINNNKEREFTGTVGNQYLKKFIITLDYKNRRIGFILNNTSANNDSNIRSWGFNTLASKNNLFVSSVFKNSKAYQFGIEPGDEIYSINGIKISELPQDKFCEIYRGEYKLINSGDKLLNVKFIKNATITKFQFKQYKHFDNSAKE